MAQKVEFPNVNAFLIPDQPTPSVNPKTTTFIGQFNGGTAVDKTRYTNIAPNSEDALFGANSQLALDIREYRKVNKVSRIDAVALADAGSAVKATGTIDFTGSTATEAGTLEFSIGSADLAYEIAITNGDTATIIGDKLVTAITNNAQSLVTAVNTTGSVALTAVNGGTVGNGIGLLADGSVAGVTVALSDMASGAVDPTIDSTITDLLVEQTDIVMPYTYGISVIRDFLNDRFDSENKALNGVLITSLTDTSTNVATALNAENSPSVVVFADKPVDTATKKGSAIFATPSVKASAFQAVRTLRLEDGEALAGWITSTEPNDNIGGVQSASLPYANTKTLLPIVPAGEGFDSFEVDTINDAGGSVMGNNRADNTLIVGQVLTTYKTNVQGYTDETYKYLNYVDTAQSCREYILNAYSIDYAQSRLSLGQVVAGHSVATAGKLKRSMLNYQKTLGGAGFVLLQSGAFTDGTGGSVEEVVGDNTNVTLNVKKGEAVITTILPIMTQLRSLIVPLNIRFNVNEL